MSSGIVLSPDLLATLPPGFGIRSPQLGPSTGSAAQFWALLAARGVVPATGMAVGSGATAASGTTTEQQLRGSWPVHGQITSTFGPRNLLPGEQVHTGIDLAVPVGTPVQATADGVVSAVGPAGGYGLRVEIRHPDGTTTLYAHLQAALVQPGQVVHKGDVIAQSGNSGASTGPHVHYEIRRNGQPIDPLPYLQATPAPTTTSVTATSARLAATPYANLIAQSAQRYGLDPALLAAVIQVESGFSPLAVSSAGAKGLMQLMDSTAAALGVTDPFDPAQNIDGGARLLQSLLARYQGNLALALAAYNAGPAAVDAAGGVPNIAETQAYVARVLAIYRAWQQGG
ncbi:MAG: peptidoglycan DD-metalloendopeptidase family protein [Thermorudis peleae]|nr:peptidoglycan DD-metalloendopeptidase family protein [Thermorudis peleae]